MLFQPGEAVGKEALAPNGDHFTAAASLGMATTSYYFPWYYFPADFIENDAKIYPICVSTRHSPRGVSGCLVTRRGT